MPETYLTWSELRLVEKIAGWKAEPPSYVSAVLDRCTRPLVKLSEHVLPAEAVAQAIRDAYAASEVSVHQERIAKKAGVADVREIRERDLEFCDHLATEFALDASRGAMFWGAAAGGGNPLAALISVKALMAYCLQTIHAIGYCFGYGTEEPHERDFVLGVMLIASASTLKEKQDAIVTLGEVEDMIFEEAFEELLQDAIGEQILESAGLASLPLVGILTGAMHSAAVAEHTAAVAKYCFAERWLRDRRGIARIEADTSLARSLVRRGRARIAHNLYWGSLGAAFIVGVPLAVLFRWVPTDHAIGHGLAHGTREAREGANRLAARVKGAPVAVPRPEMIIESAVV